MGGQEVFRTHGWNAIVIDVGTPCSAQKNSATQGKTGHDRWLRIAQFFTLMFVYFLTQFTMLKWRPNEKDEDFSGTGDDIRDMTNEVSHDGTSSSDDEFRAILFRCPVL